MVVDAAALLVRFLEGLVPGAFASVIRIGPFEGGNAPIGKLGLLVLTWMLEAGSNSSVVVCYKVLNVDPIYRC